MHSRKRRVKKGGSDTCLTSFRKSNIEYTRLFKRLGGRKDDSFREMKIMIPEIIHDKTKIAPFNSYQKQIQQCNKYRHWAA